MAKAPTPVPVTETDEGTEKLRAIKARIGIVATDVVLGELIDTLIEFAEEQNDGDEAEDPAPVR